MAYNDYKETEKKQKQVVIKHNAKVLKKARYFALKKWA